MTVYWRAKFEKRIGSPIGIRSYNPLVNSARVKFKKVKARDSGMAFEHTTRPLTTFRVAPQKSKFRYLFLTGIRCTEGKGQQLACLGVRFRSGMTKEQRRPQVKGHAGGRQATGQDPDFFFDRGGPFGPNLGVLAFFSSDRNDFAWFAHGRF
jgi:hypothetical protein